MSSTHTEVEVVDWPNCQVRANIHRQLRKRMAVNDFLLPLSFFLMTADLIQYLNFMSEILLRNCQQKAPALTGALHVSLDGITTYNL